MKARILAVLAATMVGCGEAPAFEFAFDGPATERADAVAAAEAWNACGGPRVAIVDDAPLAARIVAVDAAVVEEGDGCPCEGYTPPRTEGRIYYASRAGTPRQSIVAHEMGHFFGLEHGGGNSIMNPEHAYTGGGVTEEDCRAIRALR